jgi:phosphoribosylcarboxyaminoimidazole (NCAIR) mutase
VSLQRYFLPHSQISPSPYETISWTASWPVEVVILHGYNNASVSGNQTFGKPLTAPFGGGEVAISLIKNPSGTPIASGSMDVVGNAFIFCIIVLSTNSCRYI